MVEINIHPNLISADFLQYWVVSWHGFFSFVAVTTAVLLVGRWAPLRGIEPDVVYSIAIWVIIGGFFGARIAFIIDNWEIYQNQPEQALYVWRGGLAVWGAILGGLVGGIVSAKVKKQPVGIIADMTAPALLFALIIGRLGDIVNGEHCAKATEMFIRFVWTHDASIAKHIPCQVGWGLRGTVHGVIVYEMLWNTMMLAAIWWMWGKIKPNGMVFAVFLVLYSVGRFWTMFYREQNEYAFDLVQAQMISVIVLIVILPVLISKARFVGPISGNIGGVFKGTRAERRRRER